MTAHHFNDSLFGAALDGDFSAINPTILRVVNITGGQVSGGPPAPRFGAGTAFSSGFLYVFGGSLSPGIKI